MKRKLLILLTSLCCVIGAMGLGACGAEAANSGVGGAFSTIEVAYAAAQDLGYEGTLEEFILSITGADGKDGKDGVDGQDGVGISTIEANEMGELVVTLSDQTVVNLGKLSVEKCEHEYGDLEPGIEATCTSMGYQTRTCTLCEGVAYEFTAALGHCFDGVFSVEKDTHSFVCQTCDQIVSYAHAYGEEIYTQGNVSWKECTCGARKYEEEYSVTVTFEVDGEYYAHTGTDLSSAVEMPNTPNKPGYTFVGWYVGEGEEEVAFTENYFLFATVEYTISVHAKFELTVFNIQYVGVGDAVNNNERTYTMEDSVELLPLEMEGRDFAGWYVGEELITEIPVGTTVPLTITAKWTVCFTGTVYKMLVDELSTTTEVLSNVTVYYEGTNGFYGETVTDTYGYYEIPELPVGEYTFTFIKVNFIQITVTITVEIHMSQEILMEVSQNSTISGMVLRADGDMDMSNNETIADASVCLTRRNAATELSLTTTTNENGVYFFTNLPAGNYLLSISKEGYVSIEQYVTVREGDSVIQNMTLEVVEEPAPDEPTTGSASGWVYDAMIYGNVGVEGLTLEVRAGINNLTEGEILATLVTGENGFYTITDFEAGNYTVIVTDNRELTDETERCGGAYFNIKILAGITIEAQNGTVFSQKENTINGLTVILTWGASPSDLDSHLTGPTSSGSRFHVYYANKDYGESNLDVDDTSSYGPETTTIDTTVSGVYRFSVFDYSNQSYSNNTALKNSGAKVEVWSQGVLINTFYVPQEVGTLWTVFEYDSSTGVLETINTITYHTSGSSGIA